MRICLIGNYYLDKPLDEGMAKVGFCLWQELSQRHDVLYLSVKSLFSPEFWKEIKNFNPQVVHYVPGASIKNLGLMRTVKYYCGKAKMIISVQQMNFPGFTRLMVPLLTPDTVLVQSSQAERMFGAAGCKTVFLPNGVDIERFSPVSSEDKRKLRTKYRVKSDKTVLMHVGPLKKSRNIDLLIKMQQRGDNQVIAVASTSNPSEEAASEQLRQSGCIVWETYFENIEEVYGLSDYYIFPVTYKLGSIEIPLSVLEAMSCNLPVLATRYRALPRLFSEGGGLYLTDGDAGSIPLLEKIKVDPEPVATRAKVLDLTWQKVTDRLEQIYGEVTGMTDE